MADYSWIKPGVLAFVVGAEDLTDREGIGGSIITISSTPFKDHFDEWICTHDGMESDCLGIKCRVIRPYKEGDDKFPDWNAIAQDDSSNSTFEKEKPLEILEIS